MSDIDFVVDFPAGTRGLFPLVVLAGELEDLLGTPVDIVSEELMTDQVRTMALHDAVPV